MIIAVDVDMTVCQIDKEWLRWLNNLHDKSYAFEDLLEKSGGMLDYDLGVYYEDLRKPYKNYHSIDFFRKNGIYDCAEAVLGSYAVLTELYYSGHSIVFVSACKGGHMKSKYYWLKRKFPFMSSFVSTKEKWVINADVLIDDRLEYINPWINQTGKPVVMLKTIYRQSEPNFFDLKQYKWADLIDNPNEFVIKLVEETKSGDFK